MVTHCKRKATSNKAVSLSADEKDNYVFKDLAEKEPTLPYSLMECTLKLQETPKGVLGILIIIIHIVFHWDGPRDEMVNTEVGKEWFIFKLYLSGIWLCLLPPCGGPLSNPQREQSQCRKNLFNNSIICNKLNTDKWRKILCHCLLLLCEYREYCDVLPHDYVYKYSNTYTCIVLKGKLAN